jgi:tetratricopeptide (TPR) repeat protein
VLAGRLRVLGELHPDTLMSRNDLAGAYRAAGRLDEAIPLYQQALSSAEQVLGADNPATVTIRGNLASARGETPSANRGVPD